MVTGGGNQNHSQVQEDGEKNPSSFSRGARSWGGTFSGGQGQSISTTSGSAGSPTMATPASENTFVRLNHLDISNGDDDAGSHGMIGSRKKKRGARAAGPDKSGRGLRQFSMKVCEKVESKGRTTYNEVADELVTEFANPSSSLASPDQQQYDEKNIRRRVYDALNVLMAMDIISKDKKEIQWKGLPRTSLSDIEDLRAERMLLRNRIEKKAAYLQELEEQITGLQNLVQRNEQLYGSGNAPSGGVALPFILVQLGPAVGAVFRSAGEEQKAAVEQVFESLKLLEGELREGFFKERRFFGGDEIGILDIVLGSGSYWLCAFEEVAGVKLIDPDTFPRFHSWLCDFEELPEVKETIPAADKLLEYAKGLRQFLLSSCNP